MRQIALDTETTGISHAHGHRVIEIGCVELINRKITGKTFHTYLNPERAIDDGAFKVHGLSQDFLKDHPVFKDVLAKFLDFINGAELIIHNAAFDVGFLDAELKRAKNKTVIADHCEIYDTLVEARKKHPGQRNTLDALCKRYYVNNKHRTLHGALLDAQILSHVYLAMTGGQGALSFEEELVTSQSENDFSGIVALKSSSPVICATEDELALHDAFME